MRLIQLNKTCAHKHRSALHGAVTAFVLGLAAWLGIPASAHAGRLYVPNFSFESQPTDFADPRIDAWEKTPQPPVGFDTNIFGDWTNLTGLFFNSPIDDPYYITNADGSQLAFIFAYPQAGLFQDVNSTDWSNGPPTHAFNSKFEAGKAYHLTVGLTSSSEEPLTQGSTIELSLYYLSGTNMITVASNTVTYDTNVFTNLNELIDFTLDTPQVHTNDAWAGQNIGIEIQSTVAPELIGGVWDADNVRLTETIVVPNFSFESQPTEFADPRIDAWEKTPQPPVGFDTNVFGAWTNLTGTFFNSPVDDPYYIANADGSQLAFVFAYPQAGFYQDFNSTDWSNGPPTHAFNATFQPGKSYTLTVGLTSSSVEPLNQGSTLQLSLYYLSGTNMIAVASSAVTYDTNVFTNLTELIDFSTSIPIVKSNDPWAGQTMGVQIQSTALPALIGGVWDADNVRVSETVATALQKPVVANGQIGFNVLSEPNLALEVLSGSDVNQAVGSWAHLGSFTNITGTNQFVGTVTNITRSFYVAHRLQ